jgi:adenine-specific DNA-methyltransferase
MMPTFGKPPQSCTTIPILDLLVGGLKATGAGNLFKVFGEPNTEVTPTDHGQQTVEIRGLDVYDPTTGQLRSSSVDDIAVWFLDTDYDRDAFFGRHTYFTGRRRTLVTPWCGQ